MKTPAILFALLLSLFGLRMDSAAAEPARIVIMIGEDEYKTWETLPVFAEKDLRPLGHRVTIIHADETDKNKWPGLEAALHEADLLVVSVRRRTPYKEQLDAVRAHLAAGKPLVGIRTASHAFALLPKKTLTDPALAIWQEFDKDVLGGHYTGHYGKDEAAIRLAPDAGAHPILAGVDVGKLIGHGGLYKNTPLEPTATALLMGSISDVTEPVAWTHLHGEKKARVFYTSLGHWDDFASADFRRLLTNGITWALQK